MKEIKENSMENSLLIKCPVELTLSKIGGKWKCIILFHLLLNNKLRYSEIKKIIPGITPRMLTLQLRELESDELISRKIYAEVPPRVEYSITDLGKSLKTIIFDMRNWGNFYCELNTDVVE